MSEKYLKVKDLTSYDYVKYVNRIVVIPCDKNVNIFYKEMVDDFRKDYNLVELIVKFADYYVGSIKNFDDCCGTSICIYYDKSKSKFYGVEK